jgi:ABC-type transport system involved in cytochrome bd biosynthesis fused ATPase/permease subunit
LYLLEVNGIAAAFTAGFIFSLSGVVIVSLFAWQEARAYAAARYRIYRRRAVLMQQPQFVVRPLAISRSFSRFDERPQLTSHTSQ